MTPVNPRFAAAVLMARRALHKRIAARARELQAAIGVRSGPRSIRPTTLPQAKRIHVNNSDGRAQQIRREQGALLEGINRQQAIDREETELARLKPLLPADIKAAWDAVL